MHISVYDFIIFGTGGSCKIFMLTLQMMFHMNPRNSFELFVLQLLRRDEALSGVLMKPRRPRAVVLCPTRELSEQVFAYFL